MGAAVGASAAGTRTRSSPPRHGSQRSCTWEERWGGRWPWVCVCGAKTKLGQVRWLGPTVSNAPAAADNECERLMGIGATFRGCCGVLCRHWDPFYNFILFQVHRLDPADHRELLRPARGDRDTARGRGRPGGPDRARADRARCGAIGGLPPPARMIVIVIVIGLGDPPSGPPRARLIMRTSGLGGCGCFYGC